MTFAGRTVGVSPAMGRRVIAVGVVALCFAAGWALPRFTGSNPVFRAVADAYVSLYYAGTGRPGEPRVYYVFGDDLGALPSLVDSDPDILSFEPMSIPGVAVVTLSAHKRHAVERVSNAPGVNLVLSIPFLCH